MVLVFGGKEGVREWEHWGERESAGKGGIAGSWGHRKKEDKIPPLYTLSISKAEEEGNKILL